MGKPALEGIGCQGALNASPSAGEVNIYHCNTVISVTGKGKLWQDASLLLGMLSVWELRPTTSSFNAAISARVEMDKGWSRSISILQKMQQVRVEAETWTCIDKDWELWHRLKLLQLSIPLKLAGCHHWK
eukprot:g25964.t1